MVKLVTAFIVFFLLSHSIFTEPASKEDIRQLIHHIDKRFEAIDKRFEAVDKRFEAVDKRFEDMQKSMDKRFDMLMWFIGILTVLSTAALSYMIARINRQDDRLSNAESRFQHVDLSTFLRDLREADPAIKKGLKEILK